MARVRTGLDVALRDGIALPGRGRAALLCNATTVTAGWMPTAEALATLPGMRLERIFSPQHGFASEKQDNMIASAHGRHPRLQVPIVSLYGERREPEDGDFDGIDVLVVDLADVGTRVYTFLVTAVLTLRAARRRGVPAIVLDRPNPIGGAMEGPILEDGFHSFVGILDIPLRHGLTLAEGCLYGAWRDGAADLRRKRSSDGVVECDGLRIVTLEGWRPELYFGETGLPWTMPSPNMPTPETALVYPGQVLLEGTNLSEGRGTTRPFELFGAPYLDPGAVISEAARQGWLAPGAGSASAAEGRPQGPLDGALLREAAYEPTFNRYAGRTVRGFQIHVLHRDRFRPVAATVALLDAIRRTHPDFAWREPPYEYEWERLPIDLICGTDGVRRGLEARASVDAMVAGWQAGIDAFRDRAREVLLYDRSGPRGA